MIKCCDPSSAHNPSFAVKAVNQWLQIAESWWDTCLQHLQVFTYSILLPMVKTQPWSCRLIVFVIVLSLTVAQNEDVVERFLEENASAGKSLLHRSQSIWPEKLMTIDDMWSFCDKYFNVMTLYWKENLYLFSSLALLPLAVLQEIDAAASWPCKSGRIPKTLRFDPSTSQTSGLFVAKFTKIGL